MILTQFHPHSSGVFLALILFLSGCEKIGEQLTNKMDLPGTSPAFPITRTLTDSTGRILEVSIIARGVDSITVIRKSDGTRFEILINRLSPGDQVFARELPLYAVVSPVVVEAPDLQPAKAEKGILGFRREKLEEVDALIRKNETLLMQMNGKSMKGRSLRSETQRLIKQRAELMQEIIELEAK